MKIIACLNGAFAFGRSKEREYLSDIVAREMGLDHGHFRGEKDIYLDAKGNKQSRVMSRMSVQRGSRFRRGRRATRKFILKHNHPANVLYLFGKSTGVYNFTEIFADLPNMSYSEIHCLFVDGNFGPLLKNRNEELFTFKTNCGGVTLNYFQRDKLGGFRIVRTGNGNAALRNIVLTTEDFPAIGHFTITSSNIVKDAVSNIIAGRLS